MIEKFTRFFETKFHDEIHKKRLVFRLPLDLPEYKFYPTSPEHKGSFENAVDISAPVGSIVLAPHDAIVVSGKLDNREWGPGKEYTHKLNWVNFKLLNPNNTSDKYLFFELAHVALLKGRILRVGDQVRKGEPILVTALNGRITSDQDGNPDSHLHFLVGKWLDRQHTRFQSLKIHWDKPG